MDESEAIHEACKAAIAVMFQVLIANVVSNDSDARGKFLRGLALVRQARKIALEVIQAKPKLEEDNL